MNKLKCFRGESYFKRAAMSIFVKISTNEDQVKALTHKFKELDQDGSGMIDVKSFRAFINKNHSDLTDAELKSIITELDTYGNG